MAEYKKIRRLDMGACTVCGRSAYHVYNQGGAMRLKDHEPLCGHCVRKIRFMYPVSIEQDKKNKLEKKDPLLDLTSEDVHQAMEQFIDRLEDLREKYNFHNAVFEVSSVSKEGGGLFSTPKYRLEGRVLYGSFFLSDNATLLHGTESRTLHIADLSGESMVANREGKAGYPCRMTVSLKGLPIQTGDLIVKD